MVNNGLVLTVSQLNSYVRTLLESDENISSLFLSGEISNFVNHYRSGHFYLTLKDSNAVIKAVMFRSAAERIKFMPENGMKVVCRGRVSLFERDGQYQFYIDEMQPDGAGALQIAFQQLCDRLRAENLFDEERKLPIPEYPVKIAVITSPTGAAVQDILNVLKRRYPIAEILLCPVQVQGENAAGQMIEALHTVARNNLADVVIIGRGGGSIEELWAFNDETLARAIVQAPIPVISAVGHETDFTICDFAADLRAPTPSAAAEIVAPEIGEIRFQLHNYRNSMCKNMDAVLVTGKARLDILRKSRALAAPMDLISRERERLYYLERDLFSCFRKRIGEQIHELRTRTAKLASFNPLNVLKRGYAVLYSNGVSVRSASEVAPEDAVLVRMADGEIACNVNHIRLYDGEGDKNEEKRDI